MRICVVCVCVAFDYDGKETGSQTYKRYRVFCDGLAVAPRAVHHLDIVLPAILDVDVIRSHGVTDNTFPAVPQEKGKGRSRSQPYHSPPYINTTNPALPPVI